MIKEEFILLNEDFDAHIESISNEHQYFYKYLPLEFLLDSFENGDLIFVNPNLWNDPFDNYLFKVAEEEFKDKTFTKDLFCYCMTLNPHSQAYWNTYGNGGFAVRMRINTREFLRVMKSSNLKVWIGKLKYYAETDFIRELRSIKGLKSELNSQMITPSFLRGFILKRKPFEYEREVRILIESSRRLDNLKRLNAKMPQIVNELRLDPNMKRYEEMAWKIYLKNRYNVKVTKSQLFIEKTIL